MHCFGLIIEMFNLCATRAGKNCLYIKMHLWNNTKVFLIGFMQCLVIELLKTNTKFDFFSSVNKIADTFEFAKTF